MREKPRLLVVGSMNRDIIFYGPEGDQMARNGQLAFANCGYYNGGKAANQAMVASRLGAETTLVGAVGRDANGDGILRDLEQSGIDVRFVRRLEGVPTGLTAIFTMPDGSYYSANVRGGNDHITPELVREAMDAGEFDMALMQMEMPLETVYGTYELARERGIPVILDAGPPRPVDLSRLDGIFMISPNEAETEALAGIPVTDEASALRAARAIREKSRARYVLLKLGGRGAFLLDGADGASYPAFRVNCVDATAAGDAFTMALAISLCRGEAMADSIRRANAAGALCVSRKGGIASVPSAGEIERFLRERASEPGAI